MQTTVTAYFPSYQVLLLACASQRSIIWLPSKHGAFTQCCFNVGPASETVGQHWNSIGWMPHGWWLNEETCRLLLGGKALQENSGSWLCARKRVAVTVCYLPPPPLSLGMISGSMEHAQSSNPNNLSDKPPKWPSSLPPNPKVVEITTAKPPNTSSLYPPPLILPSL